MNSINGEGDPDYGDLCKNYGSNMGIFQAYCAAIMIWELVRGLINKELMALDVKKLQAIIIYCQ